MINNSSPEILTPSLQEILKYAPRPEDKPSLLEVLNGEIRKGARRIGVFGSRLRKDHQPYSDLDIAVLNPKAGITLPDAERFGDLRFCTNFRFWRWIDVQRFNPSQQSYDRKDRIRANILRTTLWLWERQSK